MNYLLFYFKKNWQKIVGYILSFIAGVLTNLVSDFLTNYFALSVLTLVIVVLGVLLILNLVNILTQQNRDWVLVKRERQPPKFRGLIILVGKGKTGENPLETGVKPAIEYHLSSEGEIGLEYVWLIPSQASIHVAEAFREKFETQVKIFMCDIFNEFTVQSTYDMVRSIYEQKISAYHLLPEEVISDFTGGTKPMSAGMVLACQDKYPMQYMSGRPDSASKPIYIHFTPVKDPNR